MIFINTINIFEDTVNMYEPIQTCHDMVSKG